MHHVYRGINHTKREVYFGVGETPISRVSAHCAGLTKTISHWNCGSDRIAWSNVSRHRSQAKASEVAHGWEEKYQHPRGYRVHNTRGV